MIKTFWILKERQFVFIIAQRNVALDTLIKRVKELRGSCSFVYTAAAFIIF